MDRAFCVASVALGDIDLHIPWQVWHLWHLATSTSTLRGRRGTYGTGLAPTFTLRGRRGTWRHGSCTLRGRRGAWRHRPPLCVAGVALMALDWLWWRAWVPVDAVVAAAVGVAGVALGDIDLHFVWQAWHLATSIVTLRGRHGTWRHRPPLCVAGVALLALDWLWWRAWVPVDAIVAAAVGVAGLALGDIDLHFVWQAWHLATSIVTLRGRHGTYGTGLALVARLGPS